LEVEFSDGSPSPLAHRRKVRGRKAVDATRTQPLVGLLTRARGYAAPPSHDTPATAYAAHPKTDTTLIPTPPTRHNREPLKLPTLNPTPPPGNTTKPTRRTHPVRRALAQVPCGLGNCVGRGAGRTTRRCLPFRARSDPAWHPTAGPLAPYALPRRPRTPKPSEPFLGPAVGYTHPTTPRHLSLARRGPPAPANGPRPPLARAAWPRRQPATNTKGIGNAHPPDTSLPQLERHLLCRPPTTPQPKKQKKKKTPKQEQNKPDVPEKHPPRTTQDKKKNQHPHDHITRPRFLALGSPGQEPNTLPPPPPHFAPGIFSRTTTDLKSEGAARHSGGSVYGCRPRAKVLGCPHRHGRGPLRRGARAGRRRVRPRTHRPGATGPIGSDGMYGVQPLFAGSASRNGYRGGGT